MKIMFINSFFLYCKIPVTPTGVVDNYNVGISLQKKTSVRCIADQQDMHGSINQYYNCCVICSSLGSFRSSTEKRSKATGHGRYFELLPEISCWRPCRQGKSHQISHFVSEITNWRVKIVFKKFITVRNMWHELEKNLFSLVA